MDFPSMESILLFGAAAASLFLASRARSGKDVRSVGHGRPLSTAPCRDLLCNATGARDPCLQRRRGLVISNRRVFQRKREALIRGGMNGLEFVADFDRTMTRCYLPDGTRGQSCHGIVESTPGLSSEYKRKTGELFKKYYPIEISSELTMEQKLPIMSRWYAEAHNLLLKEEYYRSMIVQSVADANTELREGSDRVLSTLAKHKVPTLVFSAGIGDVIEEFFIQHWGPLPDSLHVISNRMRFDESGRVVGFSDPLIHMFNKIYVSFSQNESHLHGTGWFEQSGPRPNALLLGDGLGDVSMADGSRHDTVLRIGFLNEDNKIHDLLPLYQKAYDVVVLHDGSMDFVMDLLDDILHGRVGDDGLSAM